MWKKGFKELLPLLGHRNWVLIVDKAFPLQSSQGMKYIDTGEPLTDVLEYVLAEINEAPHLKPVIYTDRELEFMSDDLCSGVKNLRRDISGKAGKEVKSIPHDEIFAKLDNASKLFNVAVLKTESLMPYTSVFIELDCGYWDSGKEKELKSKMK